MKALQIGTVVKSLAGRDKERHSVVVALENEYVFIADGKMRKLETPKRKNKKHIWPTGHLIQMDGATNKSIGRILGQFDEASSAAHNS